MSDKKIDKQKIFTAAVILILISFFAGGFLIGLERVRSMEGSFPPNDVEEGISPAPATAEEAIEYLDKVVAKALEENPRVSSDDSFSLDTSTLETNGSEALKSTLLFIADAFTEHISTVEESENKPSEVNFGEDISTLLRIPVADVGCITDFLCEYIYYECPTCGLTDSEQLPYCEPCGSNREYYIKYRPEYNIEISFMPNLRDTAPHIFEADFGSRTDEQIDALTSDVLCDVLSFDKREYSYNSLKICFKVNRLTDEISYLSFVKGIDFNANITFIEKYAPLGKSDLRLSMTEKIKYDFTWPALTLNEEIIEIEPKSTDNLLATLTCDEPLAMTVCWSSSDDSIVAVDAEGYISTTAKTGEAVITASFEYLGKTYSDTCLVKVKTPVESMKMSKKSIDLAVGEAFTLSTKISPKKATVQTVKWYSENDSVATVDENGVVTAIAKGEVVIYALSDDGYFRSTCEVTVE